MFSKLKEKLKGALSVFSRKAEEEAVEKKAEAVVEKKVEVVVEKKMEVAAERPIAAVVEEKAVEKKKAEVAVEKEKKVEVAVENKKAITASVTEPVPATAGPSFPEEKGGFFTKVKKKFTKKEEVKKEEAVTEVTATKKREPQEAPMPAEAEKVGFFEKIKQTITTKTISAEKFEELFWDLELALLENNVSVEVIERIKDDLKEGLVEKPLPRNVEGKIIETLKQTLQEILSFDTTDFVQQIKQQKKKPYIIAFFGINGSGKTTSIAKIAAHLQKNNLSVVLAASDTFRAAAIQQLEEHGQRLGARVIKHDYGADAAAVAFDAVKFAEKNQVDVVLIDTAGRLHSNTNLMQELEKIIRVAKPDLKLFVGESITGNDCIEQARQFNELVELDGSILTKADVDEKGGAPLSIAYTIKKPILFLGTGQRYEDLEVFEKDIILGRLGL
ncbi:MAG: signal recognition particle-docking protein FtsY [Nanoarchaeota archaeon]